VSKKRVDVVPLTDGDIEAASSACARAFHTVELMDLVLPDSAERSRLAPVMFEQGIRFAKLIGEALVPAGRPSGLLLSWKIPHAEPSLEQLVEAGLRPLGELIGEDAVRRFERLVLPIEEHQAQLIPQPCWYLAVLGVDPEHQCEGIGSALVRSFTARAEADRIPSCLWTTTEANVGFYESLGFSVVADAVAQDCDLRYWIFRRDPIDR